MFCKKCGEKLSKEVKFCKKCGTQVVDDEKIAASNDLKNEDVSKYKGIGGWLILVIIGLFVNVIRQAYYIYGNIVLFTDGTVENLSNLSSEVYVSGYAGALKFEIIVMLLFLVFMVYLISLFFKKNKKFPKYYITLLIASIVFIVLDYLILSSLTIPSSEMKQIFDEETSKEIMKSIAQAVLALIIWGTYMVKSKRVKATFVEN